MKKSFWHSIKTPILTLAPQSGITDSAFRQLTRSHGADVVFTEFASIDGMVFRPDAAMKRLKFDATEHPVVCQIFGNKPEYFHKATQMIEQAGFDGVDINMGCPAKKVFGNNGGVSLMRDLKLVREIVEATCSAAQKIPVSIKIRRSIGLVDENNKPIGKEHTALDLLEAIKDLPVQAITIHGRSYEKPFIGDPDFGMIKAVKESFDGIVIGNGGIFTPEDAQNMLTQTSADGLAIARGVYGNPWIFQQIRDYLATGKYAKPEWSEIKREAIKHAELMYKTKGTQGVKEMRKHLGWYVKGFPNASQYRKKLMSVETPEQVQTILESVN